MKPRALAALALLVVAVGLEVMVNSPRGTFSTLASFDLYESDPRRRFSWGPSSP